jgi:hypothetical protein
MPATGVISGAVGDRAAIQSLESVDGVAGVEQAQEVQIPPPESPIQ